jgi:hypothetical protein
MPPFIFLRNLLGLGIACGAFLKCLFNKEFAGEVVDLALSRKNGTAQPKKTVVGETPKTKVAEKEPNKEKDDNKENYHHGAVRILAEMQKEGRLIDFLQEDLENYSDEEIGGSVRTIHEGCKKVMDKSLSLEKILDQEEESTCRINKDYDAKSIKLTGRVGDIYPMKGTLVHPGWKVKEVNLTQKTKATQNILAPAEVEIE